MIYILIYLIITFSTFLLLDHNKVHMPELDNKDLIIISVLWPLGLLLFVYRFLKGFYDMFKK